MRLAREWGVADVDAMLAGMTSRQLTEFMASERLDGSPPGRLELVLCKLAAMTYNANKKKSAKPKCPDDYRWKPPPEPEKNWQHMREAMDAVAAEERG